MEIWKKTQGLTQLQNKECTVWRIVETQSKSMTRKLVDSDKEHAILEKLLDTQKPSLIYYGDEGYFKNLHILLFTPFRYPPLKNGSRFGHKFERNLFYSSLEIETAMTEKAYYRFAFILASDGALGGKNLQQTAFKINIKTNKYINLCEKPFSAFRHEISSPTTYSKSQPLGNAMREDGIEAFLSFSARCSKNGKNLNIFTPKAFAKNNLIEDSFIHLNCFFTRQTVEFSSFNMSTKVFAVESFYVDGEFPFPAI